MDMVGGLTGVMQTGVYILWGMLGFFVLVVAGWLIARRGYRLRGE